MRFDSRRPGSGTTSRESFPTRTRFGDRITTSDGSASFSFLFGMMEGTASPAAFHRYAGLSLLRSAVLNTTSVQYLPYRGTCKICPSRHEPVFHGMCQCGGEFPVIETEGRGLKEERNQRKKEEIQGGRDALYVDSTLCQNVVTIGIYTEAYIHHHEVVFARQTL